MNKTTKNFVLYYESDRKICGSYEHEAGRGNSLKTIKGYVNKTKESQAEYNPRNFYYINTETGDRTELFN